jgi:hypothetical protein
MTRSNVGFTFYLIFYTMQRCLIGSSLVMKCGVFNITWKQKPEHAVENTEFISACMSCPQFKTMLVCFFDHKGIVHYEFIAQGQMANQQCYLKVLTRLQKSVLMKRCKLWPDKWIFHHDNAPAHDVLRVHKFLAKKYITKIDHPPYSPDLAP